MRIRENDNRARAREGSAGLNVTMHVSRDPLGVKVKGWVLR